VIRCTVDLNGWLTVTGPHGASVIELGGGAMPQWRPNVDVRYCVDAAGVPTVDFTADFGAPLPITSDEWDVVFSRYAIEHISGRLVAGFIAEVFRILKPGGTAMIVTANAEAQMRWALARPSWDERVSQCLGGDQDYPDNSHRVFLNPAWAARLFRAAGFGRVIVTPHGEIGTDMVIEATKVEISRHECKVCGATVDAEGRREHGRGCYVVSEDGGGSDYPA
jgi:SAM-dependent methyltransferase